MLTTATTGSIEAATWTYQIHKQADAEMTQAVHTGMIGKHHADDDQGFLLVVDLVDLVSN